MIGRVARFFRGFSSDRPPYPKHTSGAGGPPGPDRAAVTLEPHLTRGVTQQFPALLIGEDRSEVQGGGLIERKTAGVPA